MQDYACFDNVYCLEELTISQLSKEHVLRLAYWTKNIWKAIMEKRAVRHYFWFRVTLNCPKFNPLPPPPPPSTPPKNLSRLNFEDERGNHSTFATEQSLAIR